MTSQIKQLMLWIAPLGGACVSALMLSYGWAIEGALTAGLTLLCALWWIFEPIPIPATSMIPLGVMPLLGILELEVLAQMFTQRGIQMQARQTHLWRLSILRTPQTQR